MRQAEYLGQPVGDVDDAASLSREPLDDGQDTFDLPVGQRGCRLIEDQDACVANEQACDFEQLHLGDAEALDRRARIEIIETDAAEQPSRAGVERARQPERRNALLAEHEILGDAEGGDGTVFLMHDRHARRLRTGARVERRGRSVDLDRA